MVVVSEPAVLVRDLPLRVCNPDEGEPRRELDGLGVPPDKPAKTRFLVGVVGVRREGEFDEADGGREDEVPADMVAAVVADFAGGGPLREPVVIFAGCSLFNVWAGMSEAARVCPIADRFSLGLGGRGESDEDDGLLSGEGLNLRRSPTRGGVGALEVGSTDFGRYLGKAELLGLGLRLE